MNIVRDKRCIKKKGLTDFIHIITQAEIVGEVLELDKCILNSQHRMTKIKGIIIGISYKEEN